jgi:hypothetical protein
VRGAVNSFSPPPLSSPINGEEALEEIFLTFFFLHQWKIIKVRGAVKVILFPLPLPLRERARMRGVVNSFSPPPLSSPSMGRKFLFVKN